MRPRDFRRRVLASAAVSALSVLTAPAFGATYGWVGSSVGAWSSSGNWSPSGPPPGGNNAAISIAAASGSKISFDVSYIPSVPLGTVYIDSSSAYPTAVVQSAASAMYATYLYTGYSGIGSWNQSVGVTGTNQVVLGFFAGSQGTYNLTGGTFSANNSSYVGGGGTGTFIQHGGTANMGSGTAIGQSAGSSGTITLDASVGAAVMNTGILYVGQGAAFGSTGGAVGRFNQAGGTLNTNGVFLGFGDGSAGYFSQSGGVSNNFYEQIGSTGYGAYTQTGGTHVATAFVDVGEYTGSSGYVSVSGGTYNIAGGVSVGYNGPGQFSFSGGTANLGSLAVGANSANGYYQQTGGTMNVPGAVTVGGSAGRSATLTIGGGTLTAGSVSVTNNSTSSLTLTAGVLSVGSLSTNGVPTNFIWTGGTLAFTASGLFVDAQGNAPLGATVNLNPAQTLNVSGAVLNNGVVSFNGGTATFSLGMSNYGQLTGHGLLTLGSPLYNENTISVPSGLFAVVGAISQDPTATTTLGPGATLRLSGAGFNNDGLLNLNGGRLSGNTGVAAEQIFNSTDGTIIGPGTIGIPLTNYGLISVAAGQLTLPGIANGGTIVLDGSSAVINSAGSLTNNGVLQGRGRVNMPVTNNGTIEAVGGTLTFASTTTLGVNGLVLAGVGAELLFVNSGLSTNPGTIGLTGGTLDTATATLTNTGKITGYGTITTGGLTNAGTITIAGNGTTLVFGPVTNNAGANLNIKYQPAVFNSPVVNNGTIKTTGTTATFVAGLTNNGSYTSDPSNNLVQGNLSNGGNMSGGVGDVFIFSSGTFTNTGMFNNSGTLHSSDPTTNSGTFIQTGPQNWSAGSTFTNTAGTATFGSDAGGGGANLSVVANGGSIMFGSTQHLAGLTVAAGGTVVVTSTSTRSVVVTPSLSDAGTIDLSTGDIDLPGGTLSTVTTLVTQSRITSSTAAADAKHLTAVGVIQNNQGGSPIYSAARPFDGVVPGSSDVLVKFTYYGDANLDGKVDGSDYTRIDSGYLSHSTGWFNGDFNYDGSIDGSDYSLVDNAYNRQTAALSPTALVASVAAGAAVPEPTTGAAVVVATMMLGRRRSSLRRPA